MSFAAKLYFIFVILTVAIIPAMATQDPNVAWYEEFFENKKGRSVDEILKQKTSSLNRAIKSKDAEQQAKSLKELALIHLTRTNDYEVAMDFLIRCLAIEDSLDLQEQRVFTYLAMAQVFEEVGNYNKSQQLLEQALAFNASLKNPFVEVLILNELGEIKASEGKDVRCI